MSQRERILELLEARGERGITAIDALNQIGSFRLAARILELVEVGYPITSTIETLPNGKRIARYRLEAPEPVQASLGW